MHVICMLQLVLYPIYGWSKEFKSVRVQISELSLYISGTGCIKTLLKLPIIRVKIDQSESRILELTTI